MKKIFIIFLFLSFFGKFAFSQEEIEYKKFKLEESSCDVGVRYKNTPKGMILGVSALATGKGAEFRKWKVSGIKLNIGGERFKPDIDEKFYVTEESFWRVPGAIVIAAIGAFGEYGGSDMNNTLSKIGVGLGLGLLALQANGEITGERCIFSLPADVVAKIKEGQDTIEIMIENENLHLNNTIKIGVTKPTGELKDKYNYDKMSQKDLIDLVGSLKSKIVSLEQEQSAYKYGEDPQYDEIQRTIEKLETERGMAYKTWFERSHKK